MTMIKIIQFKVHICFKDQMYHIRSILKFNMYGIKLNIYSPNKTAVFIVVIHLIFEVIFTTKEMHRNSVYK